MDVKGFLTKTALGADASGAENKLLLRTNKRLAVCCRYVAGTDEEDQGQQGHDVRDHAEKVRADEVRAAEQRLDTVTESEEEAADEGTARGELTEDDGCDRDEALADDDGRTELRYGREGDEGTTEARQEAGQDHADIAHGINIDAEGLTCLWMLACCTEPHTEAGLVEHEPDERHHQEAEVRHRVGGDNIVLK